MTLDGPFLNLIAVVMGKRSNSWLCLQHRVFLYILKTLLYRGTKPSPVSILLPETLWETPVGFESETSGGVG